MKEIPGLARLAPWAELPAAFVREVRRAGLMAALRRAAAARPWAMYRFRETLDADTAARQEAALTRRPLISVILPVFNPDPRWLAAALESVRTQWYPDWELCVADDASTDPRVARLLDACRDARVRLSRLPRNLGISGASNAALAMARGEYVALLDHDDRLTRDALLLMAQAIVDHAPDVLYSDESVTTAGGRPLTAHLKPDFSPDLLLAHNYITHLLVARRALVMEVGGFRDACNGAQDYDLILRLTERAGGIAHLRRVLYHWRMAPTSTSRDATAKPYALEAGRRALEDALRRRGVVARVEPGSLPHYFHVRRALVARPRVSIIIPFRDRATLLATCVNAILDRSTYADLEILAVDNDSAEPATADTLARLTARDPRVRVLRVPGPFNYARLNNQAVAQATGEQVVLMNNDIEVLTPAWVEALLAHAQRPEVGAVGARLRYPDGGLQHAGIVIGIGGAAGHPYRRLDPRLPGYLNRPQTTHNVSAVTAALLMVRTALYRDLGGLDETHLGTAFNDVDFCLRLRERGLLNVYTPDCEAIHAESASRGFEVTESHRRRYAAELAWLRQRHAALFSGGDPYYNPGLSLHTERVGFVPTPPDAPLLGWTGDLAVAREPAKA